MRFGGERIWHPAGQTYHEDLFRIKNKYLATGPPPLSFGSGRGMFTAKLPSRARYGSVIEPAANESRTTWIRGPDRAACRSAQTLDPAKNRYRLSNGFLTAKATDILKVSHLSD